MRCPSRLSNGGLALLVAVGALGCGGGSGGGNATGAAPAVPRFAYTVAGEEPYVLSFRIDAVSGQWHPQGALWLPGAEQIAVHPSGRFAFVAAGQLGTVHIDPASGELIELHSVSSLPAPARTSVVLVEPKARFAYAIWLRWAGPDVVVAYRIDADTGRLEQTGGEFPVGTEPVCLAADPSGRFLYVANEQSDNVSSFRIDPGSGRLLAIGPALYTGDGPRVVCVDPAGRFLYVANAFSDDLTTFAINPDTGQLSRVTGALTLPLGLTTRGITLESFTIEATGRFAYAGGFDDVVVLAIDAITGLPSIAGSGEVRTLAGGMQSDPSGRFLYAGGRELGSLVGIPLTTIDDENGYVGRYAIDQATGGLTFVGEQRVQREMRGPIAIASGPAPATVVPRRAYVANESSGGVRAFDVDPSTGQLRAIGVEVASGDGTCALAVARSGRFVYAANRGSGDVTAFAADPATGELTRMGASIQTGEGAMALAIEPSGRFLFVANSLAGTISTLAIDAPTGALAAPIATTGTSAPIAIAAEVTGQNLYALGVNGLLQTLKIDADSGDLVGVSTNWESGNGTVGLTTDPTGRFVYAVNAGFGDVTTYRIHTTTSAAFSLTAIGWLFQVGPFMRAREGANAVAVHPTGRFVYVTSALTDNVSMFAVDSRTGTLTRIGSEVAAGDEPSAITAEPSGAFVHVTNRGSGDVTTFAVDQETGALSEVGSEVAVGPTPSAIVIVGEYR